MSAAVVVDGAEARVTFDAFGASTYDLFLRCKRLPESEIAYDHEHDRYVVTTAARFVPLLDGRAAPAPTAAGELAGHLFDYQRWIVERSLDARRFALWADAGLGKTAMLLEWARHVAGDGGVLIVSPLQIVPQTIEEASSFYGTGLAVERLTDAQDLRSWLRRPRGVAITNYEKAIADDVQLRRLAGVVLDESSILKTGGGKTKWALIHGCKGVPHKLSCTATPAPNDTMEYASQAAWLERLRNEGEILWTWFARDKRGNWRIKPHGLADFYAFMASWSIYMRDPAAFGFAPILDSLPDPITREHPVELTDEQRGLRDEILVTTGRGLFDERLGVRERGKLAQLARGFLYERGRRVRRVESRKPAIVADLARGHVDAGRPTIVWTNFDEESEILHELLPDAAMLHGSTPQDERERLIDGFRHGGVELLITKPQLVGMGLNFQRCRAMVFSGIDDSFERRYQAVRRAYRLGQTEQVHVEVPYVPELEGLMHTNLRAKQDAFERDVAAQEAHYVRAMREES